MKPIQTRAIGYPRMSAPVDRVDAFRAMVAITGDDPHTRIDNIERAMLAEFPAIECRTEHTFTPGLYVRTIFMPAGAMIVSKIHRTTHPFAIHSGRCSVFIDGKGVEELSGPHRGITEAGTRRALYIHEDTVWSTYHVTEPGEDGDVQAIEQRIIEPRELEGGRLAYDFYLDKLREAADEALAADHTERALWHG